MISTKNCSRG
ncbi:BgTH12-00467 [Blumeria graminis f. sp. triticale]|uniref:BgTH12-00467 n=1 Tax=Blumeria graminis f. sp. triticale TaxID=1689686 RepID=A0A9W4GHJ5_BLUGR|nr:BgTH12-00467 [Blumeria graminis f. sp. triticale]